jgi:hypothetical protein
MPLERDQLGLSEQDLLQLQDALANAGFVEPFTTAAAEAEAVVNSYTVRYTLATAHLQRLQRPLVIRDLYSRLGSVPEAVQKSFDAAMSELRDIRDGKFKGLESSDGSTTHSTGGWGSRTKINFPGDTTTT